MVRIRFKPGEKAPLSGQYPIIGPRGGDTARSDARSRPVIARDAKARRRVRDSGPDEAQAQVAKRWPEGSGRSSALRRAGQRS